jgi:prepilin peptidase CpaA
MPLLVGILACVLATVSAVVDFRRGIIPNLITYSGVALGLAISLFLGENSFIDSLIGIGVGGGLFLVFWLANAMGAGDVKLMAALGALLGWPVIWDVIFFTALFGGIFGILFLIWKRMPAVEELNGSERVPQKRYKQRMPYAIPIALGTLVAVISQWL